MSLRLRAAIALTVLASLPVEAAAPEVHRAFADFKAGRYLEAVSELQAVVDRYPGYADGYFLLGQCMLKMHRPAEGEAHFRRALHLDPTRAEYYHGLAMAMNASADSNRTITVATDGLARATDPQTRLGLLELRGYALGAVQRWPEAVRDLEEARAIQPERRVLVLLGKAHFAMGAYDLAIPPLRDALSIYPDDPNALRLVAESYLRLAGEASDAVRKKGAYESSLDYARRLSALRPDDVEAIHLVGRAALGAGRLPEAEGIFLHVLFREPRQCYAMVNLGRTYMAGGRLGEAEAFLRKASACAPRMVAIYDSLGDLYMKLGRPQDAAAAFRRAEEIEPTARRARRHRTPDTIPVSAPR